MTAGQGYLRYPTVCGDTVVFACEDDLWSVPADGGSAMRLTAGITEASHPRLSPDGALIAFVAVDSGTPELYVMPAPGGSARRLTFQAARCVTVGWHPNTGEVVYASTAEQPAGFGARLFAVHPAGGAPRHLGLDPATTVSHGPRGGLVVGTGSTEPARWKRYRGGAAGELWLDPDGDGRFSRLLTLPGNLANPCWVGDRIYFISDHDGTGNVYSCRPDGTDLLRHTGHRDFYARNLTSDTGRLVYHAGARLYLIDTAGTHREVPVRVPTARTQQRRRWMSAADQLDAARLSPDGTRVAVLARGKAFTTHRNGGAVRRHGAGAEDADAVRYRHLTWVADGRLVAAAADERPGERLVLLSADGAAETDLAVEDLGCVTELVASPVTGMIAFATNRQQLWVIDADAARPVPVLLDTSVHERIEDLAFSPDGRWLAYTFPDTARTSAIKVAEVALGRVAAVTSPTLRDFRPAFDPAGRYLYFIGQRDLTPDLDQVQADVGFPFGSRPYVVTLRSATPSPFDPVAGVKPQADGPPSVEIDFADIDRRVVAVPVPEGRYVSVLGLPDQVLLLSVPHTAPDPAVPAGGPQGAVTKVDLGTGAVTEDYLVVVDELSADATGSVLLYRRDHQIRVVVAGADKAVLDQDDDPGEPGARTGWLDLGRVSVPVLPAAEWRQMVREAWRLQRESFWTADMAGLDWDAVHRRYAPLADLVSSRAELSDLLWELQGELATSHAYERGGDHRVADTVSQGFLGVDWDVVDGATPRWRIGRILRGDPWNPDATSPCNRPGAGIRPGDEVCAVNGVPVGASGPAELLVGQAGHEVELTLARQDGSRRLVAVTATASEARARQLDWGATNRAYVHTASNHRLGYVHVSDMFQTGYADFVRGFLTELDAEGLVVDVRHNGGGHVSPLVLDRLSRRRAGIERGRWSGDLPYPLESPRGPMVALINEHTGSDGEIFSHTFRGLGLGALIGRRTWGGVIATWPRHELVDGTVTTQPEFRYFLRGVGDGLENRGVEPDVEVAPPPGDTGGDRQLAAAVRHLLDLLGPAYLPPADSGLRFPATFTTS